MFSTTLRTQKRQLLHDHDDDSEEQHSKNWVCGALAVHTDETISEENQEAVYLIEDIETEDDQFNAVRPAVKIRVAMDSGACKSVAHSSVMPSGDMITPHTGGEHFSGA